MPDPILGASLSRWKVKKEVIIQAEYVFGNPLEWILSYAGISIHDVVNERVCKRNVLWIWKLVCEIKALQAEKRKDEDEMGWAKYQAWVRRMCSVNIFL